MNSPIDPIRTPLDERSLSLRRIIVKMFHAGNRGHLGSALSLVEILRVLYDEVLRYDSRNPKWNERDRCILSKGHGCMALYVLLAEKGFFAEEELWRFCRSEGILGGHPEHSKVPGVEASTGSLGHGMPIALGIALAAKVDRKSHKVFVIIGDGESNEGSVWEAALCAGKHKLSNLTVIVDYNKQQSYGSTFEVLNLEPFAEKWRAFGFGTREIDGHNLNDLRLAFSSLPLHEEKPTVVICHTIKGKGIPDLEGNPRWHHKTRVADEDLLRLLACLEKV